MARSGSGAAWGSVAAGLASVVTLPLAVYLTRFISGYDLLDAGWAIPVAIVLAIVALALSRRARLRQAISVSAHASSGVATAGRVLGVLGLCLAASALVALGVYGLLEYVGSRE